MALIPCLFFLSLLSHSILLATCDESSLKLLREEYDLLKAIDQYRISLNLTVLNVNDGADCLASEIAQVLNNKICTTNTTYANATTLSSFPGFPALLTKCDLNTTNTTVNGQILPSCVNDQQPKLMASNFTSKYATYLNSTHFSALGIGFSDDWMVVVLTNMTARVSNGASVLTTISPVMFSLICLLMLV